MYAIVSEHGTLAIGDGNLPDAHELPDSFAEIARTQPGRLIWTGDRVEDAASISSWWIAPDGTRRAFKGGEDWVSATGKWDSPLYRKADGSWGIQSAAQGKRDALHAYASKRRWREETAGVTIDDLAVPTDARTQAIVAAAYARAKTDEAYSIEKWKVGPGRYVALSNDRIIAIGEIVADHVQACFMLNAEIDEKIEADEITTTSQIDGIFDAA